MIIESNNEHLALIKDAEGGLSWHVVFVDYINMAIPYLERESDFNGDGYEAITLIKSDSIVDGLDYD